MVGGFSDRWSVVPLVGGQLFLGKGSVVPSRWSVIGVTVVGGRWSVVCGRWAVVLYYARDQSREISASLQ